ncbi:metallophosphoesterase [Apibacter sp. HY039]|uniref:metallophosphoesterase n=1 Tax=Apibacter sp. HY039 TaxID=2501476 RepID=UPI000FEC0394|nr:metallophosphoesterase [Apibacter sp. HY039]
MSRTFVVGDIHGCYDELQDLLNKINLTEDDILISVGDIVDRGMKSKEVYQFFRDRPNSYVVMGNHEKKHLKGILSYSQEIVRLQFGDLYDEFIDWINRLPYYIETTDAIIVHASLEHDKQLTEQKNNVLCGTESGEKYLSKKYSEKKSWRDYYKGTKSVIYGHRVVGTSPKIKNNTYGIDTGASHGGYLTALELGSYYFFQVKSGISRTIKQDHYQVSVLKTKNWKTMTFASIKKQLKKYEQIENEEVKEYLNEIKHWSEKLKQLYPELFIEIYKIFCKMEKDNFNYSSLLLSDELNLLLTKFKKRRLSARDMIDVYDSPEKIEMLKNFIMQQMNLAINKF